MGDSPEDEQLVAHRWAWLASDPEWLRLFRTEMTHILVSCLEVALPEEKYNPLCAEVLEAIPDALCEDGGSLTRLKARARLHRSSGSDGCAAKCAPIEPPAPPPPWWWVVGSLFFPHACTGFPMVSICAPYVFLMLLNGFVSSSYAFFAFSCICYAPKISQGEHQGPYAFLSFSYVFFAFLRCMR